MDNAMVLRGARVIDPSACVDDTRDVGIANGVFVPAEGLRNPRVFSLDGKVVAPGFVDMHVHLRYPGQVHKEDIATATRAAAAGGFTTVVAMPNTRPPVDSPAVLADVLRRSGEEGVVRVLQAAAVTAGREGRSLTAFDALRAAGAVALTDDGSVVPGAHLMLQALRRARAVGLPVLDHCEDETIVGDGAMHEGAVAERLGLPGRPAVAEDVVVARNIVLSADVGWPIHVQHVSSARAVELIRLAQARGVGVSAEATPHHIALTHEACAIYGTDAKMNPPLREEGDRRAILRGLQDGVIGVIATDHAPHAREEKSRPFAEAPSGIVGLEAAIPICLTHLYHEGVLGLSELVAKFTVGPCRVLGLPYGTLALGAPADVTILDPEAATTIDTTSFRSRSRNCPYDGWACKGRAVGTIVGGEWVWSALAGAPARLH